jgi:ribosomal protein S18 acetylase RimI-like enzyme
MEKTTFVVRRAYEGDIPKIMEITKEAFKIYAEGAGIGDKLAALEETYDDVLRDIETKEVFVALLNGSIVGSVRVEIKPGRTAYLSRFGVDPCYQHNGVGKILMNAVDNSMMELGITNLYLHTASRMLSLVRFYYGRGFYIESTTKDQGYIRALLCKEYNAERVEESVYQKCAVI